MLCHDVPDYIQFFKNMSKLNGDLSKTLYPVM